MTDELKNDGQIGQNDNLMIDPQVYDLVSEWYRAKQQLTSLQVTKHQKAVDHAKDRVMEKLTLDDDNVQRYRFQLDGEADAMVYTLKVTPPRELETKLDSMRKNNHRFVLDVAQ